MMLGRIRSFRLYILVFFFALLLGSHQGLSAALVLNTPHSNSHFAEVEGVSLHYRFWPVDSVKRKGSCFLVHGFGSSTFSWEEVADSLQLMGFEVVAVDVPPFGYSDKSVVLNQSFTARAVLFKQFLDSCFPGRRWHLAGHSMGGGVVQAMALLNPHSFSSVTLVSAVVFQSITPSEGGITGPLHLPLMQYITGELIEQRLSFLYKRRIQRLLASAYGVEPDPEQVDQYLKPLQIPGTAAAILSTRYHYNELYELHAADMKVPVMAIWGQYDTWVPLAFRKGILDLIPDLTLEIIENAGHNPMETHFGQFMEIWTPWLVSVP